MSAPAPSADLTGRDSITAAAAAAKTGFEPHPLSAECAHPPRQGHDESAAADAEAPSSSSSNNNRAAAAQSTCPPHAARLDRYALERVFAFLAPDEVLIALRICRDWLAAVKSMACRGWFEPNPTATPISVLVESAIARHVVGLGAAETPVELNIDTLFILARHMPHLVELACRLSLPLPMGPRVFPSGLKILDLIVAAHANANSINDAIKAIGCLPLLEELSLFQPLASPRISFAPLSALPALRAVVVVWKPQSPSGAFEPSDAQVQHLCAIPLLTNLVIHPMSASLLRRLLAQPRDLQWQHVALPAGVDEETAALLPHLSSLTKIEEHLTCQRFDWLSGLPNLTDISLWLDALPTAEGRAASLVAGLAHCAAVTKLALSGAADLTAAHFAELLPLLPRLRFLKLVKLRVDSLGFLAQDPLTSQLISLVLSGCRRLPLAELSHVRTLRGLQHLALLESFTVPMDAHSLSLYEAPSAALPLLQAFQYRAPANVQL